MATPIDFGILDCPAVNAMPASQPEVPTVILHVDEMIHHHQPLASVTFHGNLLSTRDRHVPVALNL
jgi:hypothetical protein